MEVLVFMQEGCSVCKELRQILKPIDREGYIYIDDVKVQVVYNNDLLKSYGGNSTPYTVFLKDGKMIWSEKGVYSKELLKDRIRQLKEGSLTKSV